MYWTPPEPHHGERGPAHHETLLMASLYSLRPSAPDLKNLMFILLIILTFLLLLSAFISPLSSFVSSIFRTFLHYLISFLFPSTFFLPELSPPLCFSQYFFFTILTFLLKIPIQSLSFTIFFCSFPS